MASLKKKLNKVNYGGLSLLAGLISLEGGDPGTNYEIKLNGKSIEYKKVMLFDKDWDIKQNTKNSLNYYDTEPDLREFSKNYELQRFKKNGIVYTGEQNTEEWKKAKKDLKELIKHYKVVSNSYSTNPNFFRNMN